jgi:hypothetical protein
MVAYQEPLHHLAEVLDDMESVGNLEGIGSASSSAVGIGTTPIPTDDLHTWVLGEPPGKGLCPPILREINPTPALQVDQDRPISLPTTEREVIDAEHPWRLQLRQRRGPDRTHHGIRAHRHRKPDEKACSCLASRDQPDQLNCSRETMGPPGVPGCHRGQLLGKDAALTPGVRAEEAPDGEPQPNRSAVPGKVGECTDVVAVDAT